MKNFFISYNRHDKNWAEWIASTLETAGFTTFIQAWDIVPGSNFVHEMQDAVQKCERTIAVVSSNYLTSEFGESEWVAAFARDAIGVKRKLVPIRVEDVAPTGLLAQIVYIDLVGLDEDDAKYELLDGMKSDKRPSGPSPFPGRVLPAAATPAPDPAPFPGTISTKPPDP